MRSSPKRTQYPWNLDANLAHRSGRCFEALQSSVSGNIHIDLSSAENLKGFEHLVMILQLSKVENVGFPSDSLCNLHREFGLKIVQNYGKSKVFHLPTLLSPSSGGIFHPNKVLACAVTSQLYVESNFKEIGALTD